MSAGQVGKALLAEETDLEAGPSGLCLLGYSAAGRSLQDEAGCRGRCAPGASWGTRVTGEGSSAPSTRPRSLSPCAAWNLFPREKKPLQQGNSFLQDVRHQCETPRGYLRNEQESTASISPEPDDESQRERQGTLRAGW